MIMAIATDEAASFCITIGYYQDCWYTDPVGSMHCLLTCPKISNSLYR